MDPYEVLGVPRGASRADVRSAYLRLARAHHPDAHAGGTAAERAEAERRMREVNEAWAVLSGPASPTPEPGSPEVAPAGTGVVRDPGGPGWRPAASDTRWMDDFEAWRSERDDLVPPERPPTAGRGVLTVLPVAVFVGALLVGSVGLVLDEPSVVAVAFGLVIVSAALFVVVPMLLLIRRRPD